MCVSSRRRLSSACFIAYEYPSLPDGMLIVHSLVVMNTSSRGRPDSATARPTSASLW